MIMLLQNGNHDAAMERIAPEDRPRLFETLSSQRPDLLRQLALRPELAVLIPPRLIAQSFAGLGDPADDFVLDEVIACGRHLWRPDMVAPRQLLERLHRYEESPPPGPGQPSTSVTQSLAWPRGAAAIAAKHDYDLLRELVAFDHVSTTVAIAAAARAGRSLCHVSPTLNDDWGTFFSALLCGAQPPDEDIEVVVRRYQEEPAPTVDVWDLYHTARKPCLALTPWQRAQLLATEDPNLALIAAFGARREVPEDVGGSERERLRAAVGRHGPKVLAALGKEGPTLFGHPWLREYVEGLDESQLPALAVAVIETGAAGAYPVDVALEVAKHLPPGLPFEGWCASAEQGTAPALVAQLGPARFLQWLGPDPDMTFVYRTGGIPRAMAETDQAPGWAVNLSHHALGADPATWQAAEGYLSENPDVSFGELATGLRQRGWDVPMFPESSSMTS